MGAQSRLAATTTGLTFALLLGGGILASQNAKHDVDANVDVDMKAQLSAQAVPAECRNQPSSPGPMPAWYAERCVTAPKSVIAPA